MLLPTAKLDVVGHGVAEESLVEEDVRYHRLGTLPLTTHPPYTSVR